jgi:hypothetical protein
VAVAWRGMPIAARQALISLMEGGFAEPITSAKIKQQSCAETTIRSL